MTSKDVANRRRRAALLREKKKDEMFMKELTDKTINYNSTSPVNNQVKESKIKRTRMQNAKGTSGMFIKP